MNLHSNMLKYKEGIPLTIGSHTNTQYDEEIMDYIANNIIKKNKQNVIMYSTLKDKCQMDSLRVIKKLSKRGITNISYTDVYYNDTCIRFPTSDVHIEIDFEQISVNETCILTELCSVIMNVYGKHASAVYPICYMYNIETMKLDIFELLSIFINQPKFVFIFATTRIGMFHNNLINNTNIYKHHCILYGDNPVENEMATHIPSIINNIVDDDELVPPSKLMEDKYKQFAEELIANIRDLSCMSSTTKPSVELLRSNIYSSFINSLNFHTLVTYIVEIIITKQLLSDRYQHVLVRYIPTALEYYSHNYRPIFHSEQLLLFIHMLFVYNKTPYDETYITLLEEYTPSCITGLFPKKIFIN